MISAVILTALFFLNVALAYTLHKEKKDGCINAFLAGMVLMQLIEKLLDHYYP